MPFRYTKLWDILEYRDITRSELRAIIGVSQSTITNMGKSKNVSLDVIDKICDVLNCTPNDIMEYYKPNVDDSTFIIKKGDFFYIHDDYKSGEQTSVIVIQDSTLNKLFETVVVVNIEKTNLSISEFDETVIFIDKEKYNFNTDYIISLDTMRPINKKLFISKFGTISEGDMLKLNLNLSEMLNLGI